MSTTLPPCTCCGDTDPVAGYEMPEGFVCLECHEPPGREPSWWTRTLGRRREALRHVLPRPGRRAWARSRGSAAARDGNGWSQSRRRVPLSRRCARGPRRSPSPGTRGALVAGELDGKVALITGGESGIGLASARLIVAEGAKVHLVGIDGTRLKAAVEELGAEHALGSAADVADEAAVREAVEEGYAHCGQLDVLFSNAGISGAISKIVDYPGEVFHRTLAVHVGGAFHVRKHGLPRLRDDGSVISTSSVVGLTGFGDISGYVAAKTLRSA